MIETILNEFLKLLPVIIGGLIAMISGGVGVYLSHVIEQKKQTKNDVLQKLEELTSLTFKCERYIIDKQKNAIFGDNNQQHVSPIDEMRVLLALHHPELKSKKIVLQQAILDCNVVIRDMFIAKTKDIDAFL